jgi:hypothetical protein
MKLHMGGKYIEIHPSSNDHVYVSNLETCMGQKSWMFEYGIFHVSETHSLTFLACLLAIHSSNFVDPSPYIEIIFFFHLVKYKLVVVYSLVTWRVMIKSSA